MVEKAQLLSILFKYYPKRVNARFIAGLIPGGATKSEVNSVLYSNLSEFSVDASYNWQLTLSAYEAMKNQTGYKERKVDELCTLYNADRFVVKKLIEVDYQEFENAYSHAKHLAIISKDIPYLLPDDTLFQQEVAKLKEAQTSRKKEWHEQFEKERKIKKLCSDNGIDEKACKRLLLLAPYEVERRINEIKAFMKKGPLVSISISQTVLLSKEEFMNYKNTFRSNGSYKCTIECTHCNGNCILK